MKIACIGEAMVELSLSADTPDTAGLGIAGDTLNTAIYLRRAAPDVQVDYITRLGTDPFSDRIRSFIQHHGVGTSRIETSATRQPGLYAITTDPTGERSFTYWRSAAAAREMFQTDTAPDFSALAEYDVLYLSAITLAILPPAIRAALTEWLSEFEGQLAFDSNYRPRLWEDQATAQSAVEALWQITDIALPSVDDEMALFDETAEQVAARFAGYAPQTGALKRGPEGPASLDGTPVAQTYAPAPRVVDTTAAGDSFNGGYLGALLTGADQATALKAGHDCAAHVVQHKGAIVPPPDRA